MWISKSTEYGNSRMKMPKKIQKVSELKGISIKIVQSEKLREKKAEYINRNKYLYTLRHRGGGKDNGAENIFYRMI